MPGSETDRFDSDQYFYDLAAKTIDDSGITLPAGLTTETLVEETLREIRPEVARALLGSLKTEGRAQLRHRKRERKAFEARLQNTWGNGLDQLETLIHLAEDIGFEFATRYLVEEAERNPTFHALQRIQGRACQIATEVLVLLESGLAGGALARWRSLHEFVVVSQFLFEAPPDTAERYLIHPSAHRWRLVRDLRSYAEVVGEPMKSDQELLDAIRDRDELRLTWGPCFDSDYGWALQALGICPQRHRDTRECRATFADLRRRTKMEQWSLYYRMASEGTHAGPRALLYDPGNADDDLLLAPATSEEGLEETAYQTASALIDVTNALVRQRPTLIWLAGIDAMDMWAREARASLYGSAAVVAERQTTGRRPWSALRWLLRRRPR